ncbi:3-deoxy-manno-octulosonate cytidylyltransferase [Aureivirga marina]|uniref:3-deoxy-manno-octulosonate cytidylyltransferase n=1 Tax=Aureivirga marina TaxID=1182451 RepID=UPI0018CB4ED8|nr:3-deoxy-manno-octulosonate cytidylyltransferase [Aureivirga marina]
MKTVVVIPARLKSTRFPKKPLIDILGKSMIQRVYEKCLEVIPKELVYVATDATEISEHCESLGFNVVLTSEDCLTGTDRIAEFAKVVEADYYINVQGDEPVINSQDIKKVYDLISEYNGEIINGYCEIDHEEDFQSVGLPKVVFREDKRLLYMSRAPIPFNKTKEFIKGFRQVCIYAFPKKALENFTQTNGKTLFENIEDIEILRFLELGYDIRMVELSKDSVPVDYPEDLEKVLKILKND